MATSTYFLPLMTLPAIVNSPGNYITRCGDIVTIECVSDKNDYGCSGFYIEENIQEQWHKSGRIMATRETQNDIVRKQ